MLTTKRDKTPQFDGLSGPQGVALLALLDGASVSEAARRAKVDRSTASQWVNKPGPFRAALSDGRADLIEAAKNRLKALAGRAADTLGKVLDDKDALPGTKVQAALGVLKTVGIGAESGVESSSNLEGVIRDLISRDKLGLAVQTLPPELHKPLAEAAGGNVFMLAIESMRRANFAEQKLEALTGTKESNDETKTDESKAVAS